MKDKIVITRYSEAYVSFALPKVGLPRLIEDMRVLRSLIREVPQLDRFLRAPEVPEREKGSFMEKNLAGVLTLETIDFVKYLITKGRIENLTGIADYVRQVYSRGLVIDAVLKSTFPLELDLVEKIRDALAKLAGRNVNLYFELDPDLLGGVQITMGNKIIDGSVKNNLNEMKKKLLKAQVVR